MVERRPLVSLNIWSICLSERHLHFKVHMNNNFRGDGNVFLGKFAVIRFSDTGCHWWIMMDRDLRIQIMAWSMVPMVLSFHLSLAIFRSVPYNCPQSWCVQRGKQYLHSKYILYGERYTTTTLLVPMLLCVPNHGADTRSRWKAYVQQNVNASK